MTSETEYSTILTNGDEEEEDESLFDFYCPTCLLSYGDQNDFKSHYKSELHQYNVKRKLVNLKPIRLEDYEKVKESRLIVKLKRIDPKGSQTKQNEGARNILLRLLQKEVQK